MNAHPLEQPILMRFEQLMAQGEVTKAMAVLHQTLAQEPNLPRVHVALAGLRWPGLALSTVIGFTGCTAS